MVPCPNVKYRESMIAIVGIITFQNSVSLYHLVWKIKERKNGLIANEKYFRSIAKILTSGSKHVYMLNGNVYSCEVVNGIFIVPDKDAYDTLKGMTAPTFHSQIRLQ